MYIFLYFILGLWYNKLKINLLFRGADYSRSRKKYIYCRGSGCVERQDNLRVGDFYTLLVLTLTDIIPGQPPKGDFVLNRLVTIAQYGLCNRQ